MLRDGQPWFLDYQGGRKGALQYDIASLLYDGKADLPPDLRQQLLDHYLDCARRLTSISTATHSWSTTTPSSTCAFCRRWALMAFAVSTSARRIFCKAFLTRSRTCAGWRRMSSCPIALPALLDALEAMQASEKLQQSVRARGWPNGAHLQLFFSATACPPMNPATVGALSSMRAVCLTQGAKNSSAQLTGKDAAVIDYLDRQPERA